MKIEEGWRFLTADFSVQASGGREKGYVMLVRAPDEKVKWHKMPDEMKDSDDGPPLYVTGRGDTFEEAIEMANLSAASAKPIIEKEEDDGCDD